MAIEVRETARQEDKNAAVEIIRSLPEYFTELGLQRVPEDLERQRMWAAFVDDVMVGFITMHPTDTKAVGIAWLAVRKDFQSQGLGRKLVCAALVSYEKDEFEICTLEAPVETEPGEDFSPTRIFYERLGFQTLYIIKPYLAWGPDGACRVMAARLPLRRG